MAVVEGMPLERPRGRGAVGLGILRRVPRPARRRPGRQRRLPGRPLDRPAGGDGRGAPPDRRPPPSRSRPWSAWSRSRWPAARSGSPPRSARATPTATAGRCRPASPAFDEFVALAGGAPGPPRHDARVHPRRRPDPRRPDGADGRHVAGRRPPAQLEPARQPGLRGDLRAAAARRPTWPRRRGAHVVALTLARHDADAGQQPCCPDCPAGATCPGARRSGPPGRRRRPGGPGPAAGRGRAGGASGPSACWPTSHLMEVADPDSPWVGPVARGDRRGPGHRRHRRADRRRPARAA